MPTLWRTLAKSSDVEHLRMGGCWRGCLPLRMGKKVFFFVATDVTILGDEFAESRIDEERVSLTGRLLGIVALHRRIEFQPDSGRVVYGKVSDAFSYSYLERITTEQFAGKRWRALFHRKLVERPGRPPAEDYTLLRLDDEDTQQTVNPLETLPESN